MSVLLRLLSGSLVLLLSGCAAEAPTASPAAQSALPSPSATLAAATASPSVPPVGSPLATPSGTPAHSPSASPGGPTPTIAPRPSVSFAPSPDAGGWNGPAPVAQRSYYDVSLVVDASGVAHAAAGFDDGIFYLTNGSGSWTRERLSTPPGTGGESKRDEKPAIALDGDGSLHIAFSRIGPPSTFGRFPEAIWLTANEGSGWSAPVELETDFFPHSPSLAVREGSLHIAYVEGIPFDVVEEDASFPLRYMTDVSGSWTDEQILPNGTDPRLQLGSDGLARVLFANAVGLLPEDGLRYAVAGTSTGSFSVELVPGTDSFGLPLDLAMGPGDVAQIIWSPEEEPGVRHGQRDTGGWSAPASVVPDGVARTLAAATDSAGALHVIIGRADGVWYASNRAGSFATHLLSSARGVSADIAVDAADRAHVLFVAGPASARQLWYGVGPAP